MPVSKQTTELTFCLRALTYRIRQIAKERQGYSKAKHRELAKLLREGREEFARIKTEDVIANDDLIAALEILELHCEQLHVRANILDHLAFGPGRTKRVPPKPQNGKKRDGRRDGGGGVGNARRETGSASTTAGSGGQGSGFWKLFGFSGSSGAPAERSGQAAEVTSQKGKQEEIEAQDRNDDVDDYNKKRGKEDDESEEEECEVYLEPELDKSAAVIFYAFPRIPRDIPGLSDLRAKLALRWGNEFATRAQEDDPPVPIPKGLVERLRVRRPPTSLVEMYLKEIARSHGIPWYQNEDDEVTENGGGDGDDGQNQEQLNSPGSSVEDPVTLPDKPDVKKDESPLTNTKPNEGGKDTPSRENTKNQNKSDGIPEVDELAKRFAALKK